MKFILFFLLLSYSALGADTPAGAPDPWVRPHPGTRIFAQLVTELMRTRDPDIVSVTFHAKRPDTTNYVVIASTGPETIGTATGPEELKSIKGELTIIEPKSTGAEGDFRRASFPLFDGKNEVLGLVVMKLKSRPGKAEWEYYKEVSAMIDYVRHRIRFETDLFELEKIYPPAAFTFPGETFPQKFVDEKLEEMPDLVHISIHAPVPGVPGGVTVATDVTSRLGHPSGPIDRSVWQKNIYLVETPQDEGVFEVQCPLLDQAGDTIGMMIIAFDYYGYPGGDKWKYFKEALGIRDELRKHLRSRDDLVTPAAAS